ncbi:response regulator [Paenibacillus doosanensis]|uniref:response regulator n=1 Tax=Paenibacillus doosanensis TaxID=1229154 RepID=UPI00217FBF03|nr:response regulator [Paenibacillus doosanensis]MCS7458589.1 response regulator [Paenibacillus doosanensis]
MYKVLLVDDEAMARIGLRSTFEWEENGFLLVGEASNGKTALQWLESHEVDILITDIAMPVMDGLELMRRARAAYPALKVVLLSCHNDFEYVREGIRLGASDYLLKPTLETEDLQAVLGKLKEQIAEERKRTELILRQELSGKRQELEKQLMKLLAGEEPQQESTAELAWLNEGYRIVVCMLDGAAKLRAEEGGLFIEIVMEEVQASCYEHLERGAAFRVGSDQLVLAVPDEGGDQESWMARLERLHRMLADKGYSFTMGVSFCSAGSGGLKRAYREGLDKAALRFYFGPGGIRSMLVSPRRPSRSGNTEAGMNALREAISEDWKDKAAECQKRLLGCWTCDNKTPVEVLREAQELLSLYQLCKGNRYVPAEQTEALRMMESVEEVQSFLWSVFESLWKSEDEIEEEFGFHRRIIAKAIEYMQGNFTKNISLQDVADHVSVSKNYFSEMFKRVTGQNFIDYLIHLRLKRSTVLLQTTTLKVYEVAEMSGFNDVKYFSKLFKKMMKLSPAEFRDRGA